MTLYYVEKKTYSPDSHYVERQHADGGTIPVLFHSLNKAKQYCERVIKAYWNVNGAKVTIKDDEYPCKGDDIEYATRVMGPYNSYRVEFRIYRIETRK